MKSALLAVAAGALLGNAAASGAAHDRHQAFHQRRNVAHLEARSESDETCGCTTYVTTVTGAATLVPNPAPSTPAVASSSVVSAITSTPVPSSSATSQVPLPTPVVTTYATPGTYTIPATTITVTDTTTVCGATTTSLTSGVNTYGGVTTSVITSTTLTCPYATVETTDSTTTSVIKTTTYFCPASGVYTVVPPTTVTATEATVTHYPTPATYTPGTYTAPEQTVTITKTNDVYYCPAASAIWTPGASTSAASTPAAATAAASTPVSSSAVDGATVTPSSTVAASTSASSVASSTSSASSSSSTSSTSSSGMTVNGNQWAITYTPYNSDGTCRAAADVLTDITDIKSKGFTTVRVYATDCNGLDTIGAACSAQGMRMIIGVYIKSDGIESTDTQEQITDITTWGATGSNWDLVDLVVVGNEAVFNGWCTAEALGTFIGTVKSTFSSAGLSTKQFTTTETVNVVQDSTFDQYICQYIDVIGVNVQPFFDSSCTADNAGDFVVSQLALAAEACPSYPDITSVLNLESGWPHQSTTDNVLAIAGVTEQASAIKSILEKAGTQSVIFSYGDDLWKSTGSYGVEKYFGCADQIELVSGELTIGGLSISLEISL